MSRTHIQLIHIQFDLIMLTPQVDTITIIIVRTGTTHTMIGPMQIRGDNGE